MSDKQDAQRDRQDLASPPPVDPSRGEDKGRHEDEIKMSQIPCEALDLHPFPEGGLGAHDGDVAPPSYKGGDMRVLDQGKDDIRA